jgi:hypothetical protein
MKYRSTLQESNPPAFFLGCSTPENGTVSCPGASAINYLPMLPSNLESRRPQEHRDGSLKFTTISSGLEKEYCATSRRVAGSVPNGIIGIFIWHKSSSRTMTLRSTQTLTETSTRNNISWGTIIMKSGSLILLEISRPVQTYTGIALPSDSKTVRRGAAGRRRIYMFFCCCNLCVLFFQTATTLLRQIVTELFGPNYLI